MMIFEFCVIFFVYVYHYCWTIHLSKWDGDCGPSSPGCGLAKATGESCRTRAVRLLKLQWIERMMAIFSEDILERGIY